MKKVHFVFDGVGNARLSHRYAAGKIEFLKTLQSFSVPFAAAISVYRGVAARRALRTFAILVDKSHVSIVDSHAPCAGAEE